MLKLNRDQYLELEKIGIGAFAPLTGFMGEEDFWSCAETGRLKSGAIFTIPVLLDVSGDDYARIRHRNSVELFVNETRVGKLHPSSFFKPDREKAAKLIFGTDDAKHPGVSHFYGLSEYFVGGTVELEQRVSFEFSDFEKTPAETKALFQEMGWKTVVGFQTRNAPHRAHEYLQKAALELCDGILIQPLVGKKKAGDFNPTAVIAGYRALMENYFPPNRAVLSVVSTVMRYAGPREAVFHALIRRNYGCTHFIVGRDHAGVGAFYDKYAAHRYTESFNEKELGIAILRMHGPYFCLKCDAVTTDKTCPHGDSHGEYAFEISGTRVRRMLEGNSEIDERIMRTEVVDAIRGLGEPFIARA